MSHPLLGQDLIMCAKVVYAIADSASHPNKVDKLLINETQKLTCDEVGPVSKGGVKNSYPLDLAGTGDKQRPDEPLDSCRFGSPLPQDLQERADEDEWVSTTLATDTEF